MSAGPSTIVFESPDRCEGYGQSTGGRSSRPLRSNAPNRCFDRTRPTPGATQDEMIPSTVGPRALGPGGSVEKSTSSAPSECIGGSLPYTSHEPRGLARRSVTAAATLVPARKAYLYQEAPCSPPTTRPT